MNHLDHDEPRDEPAPPADLDAPTRLLLADFAHAVEESAKLLARVAVSVPALPFVSPELRQDLAATLRERSRGRRAFHAQLARYTDVYPLPAGFRGPGAATRVMRLAWQGARSALDRADVAGLLERLACAERSLQERQRQLQGLCAGTPLGPILALQAEVDLHLDNGGVSAA